MLYRLPSVTGERSDFDLPGGGPDQRIQVARLVQNFATSWLWTYNHDRPNMGLGGITPKQKLALAA